jgi:hypothetical protein
LEFALYPAFADVPRHDLPIAAVALDRDAVIVTANHSLDLNPLVQRVVEFKIPANGGLMSTKNDYSAEEWKAISGAPVAAGLIITLSDASGPVGIAKEALAVGKAIRDSAQAEAPEIVKALAEAVNSGAERPELPDLPTGDRAQAKAGLIGTIRTAVGAVERKSPSEVEAYKTWLASVAARVAQASKEGGFFGIGGTLVSRDEQEGLDLLAGVLGVNVPRTAPSP